MNDDERTRTGTLAIFGLAILMNLVFVVFVLSRVEGNRKLLEGISDELATKQDLAMLRPIRVAEILERSCEQCHTKRRFAKLAGMSKREVLATIDRMRSHPGADIPGDEIRQIEAALLLFRCTSCHGEAVLSRLVLMPQEDRVRFLRSKVSMPGSGFRTDQVGQLIEAFEVLEDQPR